MENDSLQTTIKEIESLFSIFNQRFYNGELQKPVLNVKPNSIRKNARKCLGWCTAWKAWKNTAQNTADSEDTETGYYEINLCADYLNRNFTDICATPLHEMVHLWNLQQEVSDTSRDGTYHNKNFKLVAEKHGLIIKRDVTYGWTITALQPETEAFINELNSTGFTLYRISTKSIKSKFKSSTRKYICPKCGVIVRATREVHIKCSVCDVEFKPEVR